MVMGRPGVESEGGRVGHEWPMDGDQGRKSRSWEQPGG